MHRITALDPGGTTGWATFSWLEMPNGEYYEEKFSCGQLEGDHHDALDTLLGIQHTTIYTIVCESFQQYRELDSPSLVSLEYIGVVKRYSQERKVPVFWQSSSQGKIGKNSFVRKVNLQRLALWYPSQRHAMDAYGHLLYFMLNGGGVSNDKRLELLKKAWS